jgi:hypothetical protein
VLYDVSMYDDEDDEDEGLFPIELPPAEESFVYTISQFFIEHDRKEKRVFRDVRKALDPIFDEHGSDYASIGVMNYISATQGWDLEILLEKTEVEDFLLNQHSLYDENIWKKVVGTAAMNEFRREVFRLSQTYLAHAVLEVLAKEQQDTFGENDSQE